MSSKRVRLISLTGIILIMLIIGVSLLLNLLSKDTREVPIPGTSASISTTDGTGVPSNNGLEHVSVTKDNVQDVIATMKRPVSYSWHVSVESTNSTDSDLYEINVSVRDNATALNVRVAGISKNIVIAEGKRYIWYDGDATPYEAPLDAQSDEKKSSDEYQMMMSYEDVLKIDKSSITAANYMEYNGEDCIYVEYTSGQLQYTTRCYISVVTGLLTGAEQYDGNTRVYKMMSSGYDPAEPDATVFNLPDGRNPVNVL